jgi:folate-binding protein YgfZ
MVTGTFENLRTAANVTRIEVNGTSVVSSYGQPAEEYNAIREGAALIDLSTLGKLRVSGEDRARFLNGMLTHAIVGLRRGQGVHACLTTAQGQTLADMVVHNTGESFVLQTEPGLATKVHQALDRFLIADDVRIEDVTEEYAAFRLIGPDSPSVIADAFRGEAIASSALAFENHTIGDLACTVACRPLADLPGFDIRCEATGAAGVRSALLDAGARAAGWDALETVRIEEGLPRYGADVDERTMPLEAGLTHTVDFGKGCFVGQEALAKMHNLGQPRRGLVGLLLDSDAPRDPGSTVVADDMEVGWITSSVRSPRLSRTIALASIRRGFHDPGQIVALDDGTTAQVVTLPFVPPE